MQKSVPDGCRLWKLLEETEDNLHDLGIGKENILIEHSKP